MNTEPLCIDYSPTGATFSVDANGRSHRLQLHRIWNRAKPFAAVIGLNPSTANDKTNDPTITRLIGLLTHNGYGGLFMCNLFTMVTPRPSELEYDNDNVRAYQWWYAAAHHCRDVIFAWGAFKIPFSRDKEAVRCFPDALCFGKNKGGSPKHPLYLKGDTKLKQYASDRPNN